SSGKIWEARKNGGVFDKVWVRFPYCYSAYQGSYNASAAGYTDRGFVNISMSASKNASAAETTPISNFWTCPLRGIYSIQCVHTWAANGTGIRQGILKKNGTNNGSTEATLNSGAGTYTNLALNMPNEVLAAGDIIGTQWLSSHTGGGTLALSIIFTATMIEPVQ
ncbi:MAG TPA: hypothetical protein VIJ25_18865, partial [Methylococcales bacterium]